MDNNTDNLEYLKQEIERLKCVNKEIYLKLDEKTEELSDNKLNSKAFRAYIKDLEKQKQDLINKNDENNNFDMQELIRNKKLEIQTLTEEKAQLNFVIKKEKQSYIQLEQKCDQIDEQLKNTNSQVQAANQDRDLAKTSCDEFQKQLDQIKTLKDSQMKALEEEIKELKEEFDKITKENAQLKNQCDIVVGDSAEKIDLVQQEFRTLKEHNNNLTKALNEKDRVTRHQLKLRDEAITKLQTDNADLKCKMTNLTIKMEKSRQEFMPEKQKEIEKLNSELKASNVTITQHETKITELSQQSVSNNELVADALTYNNKLQEMTTTLKAENDQITITKQKQEQTINDLCSKLQLFEKFNQNEIEELNKEIISLKRKLQLTEKDLSTKNNENEKVSNNLSVINFKFERERQSYNTQLQLIAKLNKKIKHLTDKLAQNDINIVTIATLKEELNKMNNENAQLKNQHEIEKGDNAEQIALVQQEFNTLRANNTNLTKTLQEKDILINEQIRGITSLRIHYEHKNNQSSNSPYVSIPTRPAQSITPQTTPKIPASVPKINQLQGVLSQNTDTTLDTLYAHTSKDATGGFGFTVPNIKQMLLCEPYEDPTAIIITIICSIFIIIMLADSFMNILNNF